MKTIRARYTRGSIVVLLAAVLAGVVIACFTSGAARLGSNVASRSSSRGFAPAAMSCALNQRETLGYIESASASESKAEVKAFHGDLLATPTGSGRLPLRAGIASVSTIGPDVILLPAGTAPSQNAYPVLDQSADPALNTCDYTLSDRPAAQRLANDGITALEGSGVLLESQASDPGVVEMVSDNPLNPMDVIFTIEVPSSNVVPDPAEPGYFVATGPGTAYAAVLVKATGLVVAVGKAPW